MQKTRADSPNVCETTMECVLSRVLLKGQSTYKGLPTLGYDVYYVYYVY